ncbi:hypothetical protein HAX54_050466, partial [Datura stramonium]|nr:hypothetical protein [Datura stramonium]
QGEGPSLIPLRSNSFSLWAIKVPKNHQASDGLSIQPSLRPEVQAVCVKEGQRDDGQSGAQQLVMLTVT